MSWLVIPTDREVHVVPDAQRGRHELDRGCWCGAMIETANPETGEPYTRPMVTHREVVLA